MKKLDFIIFLCFLVNFGNAQNLIPNGSFEDIHSIPYSSTIQGQIHYANHWYGWNSDLYSTFSPKGLVSVPLSYFGYQWPRTGNNYSGEIVLYSTNILPYNSYNSMTEIIEVGLISKLIKNKSYNFSMWVSLADSSNIAIDFFSVYLSSDSILPVDTSFLGYPIIKKYNISPQLSHKGKGIISDSCHWIKVEFSFISNGTEKYIHFGGFLDSVTSSNYSFNSVTPLGFGDASYYFFDDISLYPSDTIPPQANAGPDKTICWGDSVRIGTHNYGDYYYQWKAGVNSPWPLQYDSGAVWVSPKYTTTYVLETTDFRYEKSYDTVTVFVELCDLKGKEYHVCLGDSVKLNDTTINNYQHLWTPKNFLSSPFVQSPKCSPPEDIGYIHYVFDSNDSLLRQDTIIVRPLHCAFANAGNDTTICLLDTLLLGREDDNDFEYQWSPDYNIGYPFSPITSAWPQTTTSYILSVSDTLGNTASDTIKVKIVPCNLPPEIIIPNIITPNGDGYNEIFQFKNEEFWHLQTQIFNRWGQLVFSSSDPERWDGRFDGKPVSEGVYFYHITAETDGFEAVYEYHGTVRVLRGER